MGYFQMEYDKWRMAPFNPNHCVHLILVDLTLLFISERMYFCPCWSSWCADGQCMLGIVLFRTWYPAWWSDAQWQDHWRWWWLLQHFLQWDRGREARPQGCLCWSRTNCHWSVFVIDFILYMFHSVLFLKSVDSGKQSLL